MDTFENYYSILGIPIDADIDTLKRAYRQLARRYHPDLAGPDGALEMKRINRAYAVLSDPEKRLNYDAVLGGTIDLRKHGFARPRTHAQRVDPAEEAEFSGLTTFSTKGPLRAGLVIHSGLGVISSLSSVRTVQGLIIAAGSLDGKGKHWQIVNNQLTTPVDFAIDPTTTVDSLRELRFSEAGSLLAGWNRLHLHVWDTFSGALLWSYPLEQRAVSAHYSLDMALQVLPDGQRLVHTALPLLIRDVPAPRAWGVRGTDVISRALNASSTNATPIADPAVCLEEKLESRKFWAIYLRALSHDAHSLLTLSCAQVPHETQQMVIIRRWSISTNPGAKSGVLGRKVRPHIASALEVGPCSDCAPPYAVTPDANSLAFVYQGNKLRICDTSTGTYSELNSGSMGSSAKLALSPDAQWIAVAREDSEMNEGVIDLWSVATGQIVQKFYHPWQISSLHFLEQSESAQKQLLVALTDGTIQVWE
jgi:hypothetical protein